MVVKRHSLNIIYQSRWRCQQHLDYGLFQMASLSQAHTHNIKMMETNILASYEASRCDVINIPTYVMLKDGLASWSAAEAITCCGKPAKESTVHPWCELWEDLTFTSPKKHISINSIPHRCDTSCAGCYTQSLSLNSRSAGSWSGSPIRMREHSEEELAGGGFTCSINSSRKWLSSKITL